jgi:hypothetical protein
MQIFYDICNYNRCLGLLLLHTRLIDSVFENFEGINFDISFLQFDVGGSSFVALNIHSVFLPIPLIHYVGSFRWKFAPFSHLWTIQDKQQHF